MNYLLKIGSVVKSKSISWDAARWSIWVTDHVTGSDRYDQHANQR